MGKSCLVAHDHRLGEGEGGAIAIAHERKALPSSVLSSLVVTPKPLASGSPVSSAPGQSQDGRAYPDGRARANRGQPNSASDPRSKPATRSQSCPTKPGLRGADAVCPLVDGTAMSTHGTRPRHVAREHRRIGGPNARSPPRRSVSRLEPSSLTCSYERPVYRQCDDGTRAHATAAPVRPATDVTAYANAWSPSAPLVLALEPSPQSVRVRTPLFRH